MAISKLTVALASLLALGGCVTTPQGPTVAVMPGPDKSLDQFRDDSGTCQQFAQAAIAGPGQAATQTAATNAAGGAAIGAAIGALIGAASGQAGAGAAWGAGTGLLFGGTAAGSSGAVSSYVLQRQYDIAYMQCMYTRGNLVPGQATARRTVPAPSYGQAAPTHYNAPSNAVAPPPDTPPPRGYAPPAPPAQPTQ